MKFNPKFGDTIVTAERGNYVCSEILPNGDSHGKRGDDYWQNGDNNWATPKCQYPEISDSYRVVEIIPAAPTEQTKESTLEFRIRVLEKENQMLTRLLMKKGKL